MKTPIPMNKFQLNLTKHSFFFRPRTFPNVMFCLALHQLPENFWLVGWRNESSSGTFTFCELVGRKLF